MAKKNHSFSKFKSPKMKIEGILKKKENKNRKINNLVNQKTNENIKKYILENETIHQKNITLENDLSTLSQKLKLEILLIAKI